MVIHHAGLTGCREHIPQQQRCPIPLPLLIPCNSHVFFPGPSPLSPSFLSNIIAITIYHAAGCWEKQIRGGADSV